MREVEVKILGATRRRLAPRLRELGAELEWSRVLDARFYDFADRRLGRRRGLLRLRTDGRTATLTGKEYVPDRKAKVRLEHEVEVSDAGTCRRILAALGLRETRRITKRRTSFRLDRCTLCFDRHTGEHSFIPEFLEIEGPNSAAVLRAARKLGFGPADCLSWSFLELEKHFRPKQ
jgi:predicted adenylyl cyclase CyaB